MSYDDMRALPREVYEVLIEDLNARADREPNGGGRLMAALTGVMTADFTQFVTEVDRSVIKLQELERGATETDSALGGFSDGLSQVDKTLGAVGVRISPQIQAMRELGAASGKTASELGLVGTAGLAVGAAMAGWQLGRMAAEWLGLDEAIGNTTAKLLGWGDVAGQTAGARMDVLTRATQLAGRAITDFGEAQRIIVEHNKAAAESLNTGTERVRQWNAELDKARASGALATITKELKDGSSTVKQLAEHFGISAEAIQYHTQRTKENAAVLNEWRENAAKVATAQAELNQARRRLARHARHDRARGGRRRDARRSPRAPRSRRSRPRTT